MLRSSVLAWLRLYRVVQKIDRAQSAYLRSWDLNTAQFDVLAHVGAHKGITQQELADSLLVTKGNISQLARCPHDGEVDRGAIYRALHFRGR